MEFRILGQLEVADARGVARLGSRLQRAVLAVLLLEAGRTVSVDRLCCRMSPARRLTGGRSPLHEEPSWSTSLSPR